MRHNQQFSCCSRQMPDAVDIEYPKAQAAMWLKRLIEQSILSHYDDDFFSFVGWCCGGLEWLSKWFQHEVFSKTTPSLNSKKLMGRAVRLKSRPLRYIQHEFQEVAYDYPETLPFILEQVTYRLEESKKVLNFQPKIVPAIKHFFGLDDACAKICTFAFLSHNYNPIRRYFLSILNIEEFANRDSLAKILDLPSSICNRQIALLSDLGILDADDISLKSKVEEIWRNGNCEDLEKSFCLTVEESQLPLDACNVKAADRDMVLRLLRHKDSSPKHILLYGAPGTGKTTFARSLAHELGVKAWSVPCKDDYSPSDRRAALTACVRLAGRHKGAFVLVDEAEYLLDTDLGMRNWTASPKAWLTPFLEQPGLRVIWITNMVEHLDRAVRRRFTYCINFPELGQCERRRLFRGIAKRLRVSSRLSDEQISLLTERYPVQVAVMENAMRQARCISRKDDFVPCLEQLLMAQVTLQNDGREPRVKPRGSEDFAMNGTCTEQPVQRLVDMCRRLDMRMRDNEATTRPGMGTMLFYGPPGTGKTALAKHLAEILDRPCLVKRASDLLSRFVGGTEANIAEAFSAAAAEDAVLVIDEADSFLQERSGVTHSWEVTQVNEFLTQLEQFNGFCICTTNFRELMDSAAMRRFSFKVPFSYAQPEQLRALYMTVLAPLAADQTPPAVIQELERQTRLTPGDFAAVHRQYWLEEPGTVKHRDMLDALLREQRLKLEASSKKIGF